MHCFHLYYFRDPEQSRMCIPGSILRLVYLRKNIRIHVYPHSAIPAILHIIVGIVRAPVQRFAVMHIPTEHIRVEVLYQLERPVFSLSEVVIKINALLNDSQTNSITIVVNNQVFIRNAGQIGIIITEVAGTCCRKQQCDQQI